jgi:hypothetical protein
MVVLREVEGSRGGALAIRHGIPQLARNDSRDFIVVDLLIEAYVSDEVKTENLL